MGDTRPVLPATAQDWMGKRFGCDFTVVWADRDEAVVQLRGELFALSLDELRVLVERGLLAEIETMH